MGYVTLLASKEVFDGERGIVAPVEWRSRRIRRVVRSSFASEIMASSEGVDAGRYVRG